MVPKWIEAAKGGREGSYRLAYDQPDSWSMKYNLVWDRILGFNLFPPEVAEAEMKAYRALIQPYGLPLDSRKTVALYHRADGTIEYQYALLDKLSYIHKQSDRNTPRPTPVSNKIN